MISDVMSENLTIHVIMFKPKPLNLLKENLKNNFNFYQLNLLWSPLF